MQMKKIDILLIGGSSEATAISQLLEKLNYTYQIIDYNSNDIDTILSEYEAEVCLIPTILLDNPRDLTWIAELYNHYLSGFVFYINKIDKQVLKYIKKFPPPIYLSKSLCKDALSVCIELARYHKKQFQSKSFFVRR